eukprot:c15008_g1_i3.p1 GENE.c15008_g1_i3~~c15008_g1_i3.p1  ORF type:complete len:145 (+),score=8.19 c15008_g1_i3:49-483(+)
MSVGLISSWQFLQPGTAQWVNVHETLSQMLEEALLNGAEFQEHFEGTMCHFEPHSYKFVYLSTGMTCRLRSHARAEKFAGALNDLPIEWFSQSELLSTPRASQPTTLRASSRTISPKTVQILGSIQQVYPIRFVVAIDKHANKF